MRAMPRRYGAQVTSSSSRSVRAPALSRRPVDEETARGQACAMTSHIPTSALPDDVKQEIEQQTWLQFAAVILLLVGAFNIIEGIAMIGNSSYVAEDLLFANLDAWGWFFLIWGVIQIWAG